MQRWLLRSRFMPHGAGGVRRSPSRISSARSFVSTKAIGCGQNRSHVKSTPFRRLQPASGYRPPARLLQSVCTCRVVSLLPYGSGLRALRQRQSLSPPCSTHRPYNYACGYSPTHSRHPGCCDLAAGADASPRLRRTTMATSNDNSAGARRHDGLMPERPQFESPPQRHDVSNRFEAGLFARNTLWMFASLVGSRLAGLIIFVLLARRLHQADFGYFVFSLSFVSLFFVFQSVGLNTSLVREIARDRTRAAELFFGGLLLRVVLGVLTIPLVVALGLLLVGSTSA